MSTEAKPDIEKLFAEGRPIDEAMSRAVRGAIERHKQAGKPMAVWGDGKTVWIDLDARTAEKPSDHTFLVAEFEM